MSTFNALNLTPHDEQLEAEEHSRELEIEECFKIFQSALFELKTKRYKEADSKFEELLSRDVIKPDKWGVYYYSSPTLDRLRYLSYRNRGMYYYSYVLDNKSSLSSQDIVDCIIKVIENLLESIQHNDADSTVTELLIQIFQSYKSKRLERMVLEYELTRSENNLLLLGRKKRSILPKLRQIIGQYGDLLEEIRDNEATKTNMRSLQKLAIPKQLPELNSVLLQIRDMKTQDERTMKELDVLEVTLESFTWEALAESLKGLLPQTKSSNLLNKSLDPYTDVEDPIEGIKFVLAQDDEVEPEPENKKPEEETTKEQTTPSVENSNDGKEQESVAEKEAQELDISTNKRPLDQVESFKPVQRSSKRFKDKDQEVSENEASITNHVAFLEELASLLELLGYRPASDQWKSLLEAQSSKDEECLPHRDLLDCLKGWSSWHTDIFAQNDSSSTNTVSNGGDTLQLNALLKSNVFADKDNDVNLLENLPEEKLSSFINAINEAPIHFQEVRYKFLHMLLTNSGQGEQRPVVDCSWSRPLFQAVEWLFLSIEQNLFEFTCNNHDSCAYLALSLYELIVNMMGGICEEISSKKLQGHRTTDLKTQRNKLVLKHDKWLDLLRSYHKVSKKWKLHFQWAHYCFLQYTCEVFDDQLPSNLYMIEKMLSELNEPFDAIYPNHRYIPRLNFSSLHSQIRKISIIRRISVVDIANEEAKAEDTDQNMDILERILLQSVQPSKEILPEDQEMLSFIQNSPFLLKLKLWEALFSYYVKNQNLISAMNCYFYVLRLLNNIMVSDRYSQQIEKQRHQILLTILITVGNFTSKFLKLLSDSNWSNIGISEVPESEQLLVKFFILFNSVLYFENRKDLFGRSFFLKAAKSSAKVKDIIANLTTLLIYYFNSDLSSKRPEQRGYLMSNFIWSSHSLLGCFGFCDASNGNFLKLSEHLLCQFIDQESLVQLKQILWCRYHYIIAGDNFTPEQHRTRAIEMDKRNSLPLGVYLIKLQYQGKNPLLASGNKASLKPVLDNIIELIGNPVSLGNHVVARNKYLLEEYLDSPLTTNILRKAFKGKGQLGLTTPHDELQGSTDAGLFYVSSIQAFNLYRIRKKSMQGRPSELDYIVAMLKNDILYNTQRFESWFLLGQCYAFMVEDDLIWTSDKLSVPEKKYSTAQTQRQAILCYVMSVAIYYHKPTKTSEDNFIVQKVFEALGSEMMSGYLRPMEKLCYFGVPSGPLLKLDEEGEIIRQDQFNVRTISDFNVEQAILFSFQQAINFEDGEDPNEGANSSKWIYYYNIGRFLFKTGRLEHGVTASKNLLKSCQLASSVSSNKDPIIEPHYSFINMCYKLVKNGTLSPHKALSLVSKDKNFFEEEEPFWKMDYSLAEDYQRKFFYQKIVKLLNFLLSVDRKKWHHRPRYRIAKIYFEDFEDVDTAITEIEIVMSVKSAHKNLVNIWKPDFERPGKHFVYTYQYVMFYLDLLFCKNDFNSIGRVCKKIRRFGSGMAYVNKAIEHALMLYTQCTRSKLQLNEKESVEHLMPSLNYQVFLKVSEDLQNGFSEQNYSEELLSGLKIAYQLKKGNNGIAFDGICISIYFKYFYLPVAPLDAEPDANISGQEQDREDFTTHGQSQTPESQPNQAPKPVTQSTNGQPIPNKFSIPRKRVSKKDVFDRIRLIVEKITCN
ncbi:hypothetical protein ZYGR_0AG03690 [Zygosaccharomyces rouxii]|uniref:Histone transcription regulator 3 homolog n=1 Tax=Zygosaccharomyces rouxii TaxID=4956 RepID=A0A1Q3A9R1_ZYGRO|nr:hypothetical protein ZYGR_0AG03690 [Zygosaccharomyces rouxii]